MELKIYQKQQNKKNTISNFQSVQNKKKVNNSGGLKIYQKQQWAVDWAHKDSKGWARELDGGR